MNSERMGGLMSPDAIRAFSSVNKDRLSGLGFDLLEEVAAAVELAEHEGLTKAADFIRTSFFNDGRALMRRFGEFNRPRFMSEPERSRVRSLKRSFLLGSDSFYLNALKSWSSVPDNFSSCHPDQSDIFESAMTAFRRIGCESLLRAAERQRFDGEFLHGHRRIEIVRAAMILAKSHGYKAVRSGSGFASLKRGVHVFSAMVHPFCHFARMAPLSVSGLLESSERSHLFDHHIVIVPVVRHSEDPVARDRISIAKMEVNPVVLGERDGVCYFVCRWF